MDEYVCSKLQKHSLRQKEKRTEKELPRSYVGDTTCFFTPIVCANIFKKTMQLGNAGEEREERKLLKGLPGSEPVGKTGRRKERGTLGTFTEPFGNTGMQRWWWWGGGFRCSGPSRFRTKKNPRKLCQGMAKWRGFLGADRTDSAGDTQTAQRTHRQLRGHTDSSEDTRTPSLGMIANHSLERKTQVAGIKSLLHAHKCFSFALLTPPLKVRNCWFYLKCCRCHNQNPYVLGFHLSQSALPQLRCPTKD